MGRLTDLLNQKGMLAGDATLNPQNHQKEATPLSLSETFRKENLIDEIKEKFKECSKMHMSEKQVFEQIPHLGEFYIPATMNGRVLECSDASFQVINNQAVVCAKAYSFDGYEVRFLFYDPADNTLQKGKFDEFPRDSFGQTMGHVGLQNNTLCWIKKNFKDV